MENYTVTKEATDMIKEVARPAVFKIQHYNTMKARDGTDVEVVGYVENITLEQLNTQLEAANKQVAAIQAKIDEINRL